MKVIIWHNPRCRKSRKGLKYLQENNIDFEIRNYLESPPDTEELKKTLNLLGLTPRDIIRKGEEEYKELGLKDKAISDEELITFMSSHPKLIERPIIIDPGLNRAVMGRPIENLEKFANTK